MTHFVGSVALIRHPDRGEHAWLTIWDDSAECYDFVVAQRLCEESYRESIDREIAWKLRLRRGKDYIVSSVARLHLDAVLPLSGTEAETYFVVEFFVVDLYGGSARVTVANNPATRWLTARELLAGKSRDGSFVSERLAMLLRKSEVIAPKGI